MQENITYNAGSTRQLQQRLITPVRRARSCHYDLRKRVLINNFLKDQREVRIPSIEVGISSFVSTESSSTTSSNDDIEVLNATLIGSDDSTCSENEPPRRKRNTFQRRVNVLETPVTAPRCRRPTRNIKLRHLSPGTTSQPEQLIVDSNSSLPSSQSLDVNEGWSETSHVSVATVISTPHYASLSFRPNPANLTSASYTQTSVDQYQNNHVTRAGIRRPGRRLASVCDTSRQYITYEYPTYKTVIPAMHSKNKILRNNSTSSLVHSLPSSHRSPKRRIPSFRRRKTTQAAKSPPMLSRSNASVFKKQRSRIQRRASIRNAFVRLLSQEKSVSRAERKNKTSNASNSKEKLRNSILETLFKWTKPAAGVKSTSSVTHNTRDTPRQAAGRDVATVVRSHSVHVPRLSRTRASQTDVKRNHAFRRKSISSCDCRALRALSNGDNGFN